MSELLKQFRKDLRHLVLGALWSAWTDLGVAGGGPGSAQGMVDPEALLLLTLEIGREDPRLFDEVLDWLRKNGEWINVTRLGNVLRKDRLCDPSILSAVAALLAEHDSSPKWRSLAGKSGGKGTSSASLFLRDGRPIGTSLASADPRFEARGWLRSPVHLRGMSQPPDLHAPAAFMLRCRAFFGLNIRADAWAYLMMNRHGTASRMARELGYTQPRVQEAVSGMHKAGAFHVRQDGNRKEFLAIPGRGWPEPEIEQQTGSWRNWRAYALSVTAVWRRAHTMKESGVTQYILDAELSSVVQANRNHFAAAGMTVADKSGAADVLQALGTFSPLPAGLPANGSRGET